MSRSIKLIFEDGAEFTCRLLEDEAPITCKAIWDLLPWEAELVHVQFSGPAIWLKIPPELELPRENWTTKVIPGDLTYYFLPRGMRGFQGGGAEVDIFYDRGGQPRDPMGVAAVNLFGRIESDLESLAEEGRRVRYEGAKRVRVIRVETPS